ncbi:hypothetical protein I302_102726 [Kwoniella bestiolae CBS 10118]|uniref:Uncharacterized protein n=1 Tax=Kwoniella bestiolae CBS 10118 TaxID=1296100 RepID=A0A1B9GFW2_9TREE|nr:hypothetical protein I302_01419 [Kwoniella bestiolae CBS 10118]OCF29906.1 hypothetical protein I302_01419 [Kwoniella bestiolae CBS 10118]
MNSKRSRLPRAASNPTIRPPPPPPAAGSTALSILPAPVSLVRQTTVTRKPSIPLRSNRKTTPNDIEKVSCHDRPSSTSTSPSKRLLPSRSTLGLTKPSNPAPVRPNARPASNPLGPKKTISTTTSRIASAASSSTSFKPSSTLSSNSKDIFKSPDPFVEHAGNPQKRFLGLGSPSRPSRLASPSRPSRIPTTPSSRPSIMQTPALPRITSIPWTSHNPDDQLKDVELSFTAEDDSSIEALDFGFGLATSRFALRTPLADKVSEKDEQSLELEKIRYERDEKVRELRKVRGQIVRESWSEVVRVGEGDLEEVKIMQELIEGLKADLDMREKM